MKLIVELDDATDTARLAAILNALASFRPYVRGATLTAYESAGRRQAVP
jgi:hypothetical protein